ncbi:MAG: DUF5615 family PIN-like protein [Candidatus Schekmanbacteria bacterium]|nr:DUF5615 family PIN-like protein [Candidatus Schekmanbacteria bacterium]
MPGSEEMTVLLGQNVPAAIASWLAVRRPAWSVRDTSAIGLAGASDAVSADCARAHRAIIITFDEDLTCT